MGKRNIFIIFFLNLFIWVNGQPTELVIPLQSVQKSAGIFTMTFIYDKSNTNDDSLIVYKGVPDNINSYIIKTLDFQPEQGVYELYTRLHGDMPLEALKQGLAPYNFLLKDTVKLSRLPVKHFVSFLVGRNKVGQVVIIGDANNNYDFSDDKLFLFDYSIINNSITMKPADYSGVNNFHYQYAYNGSIKDDSVFLRMSAKNPSIRYYNQIEQRFFLVVSLEEYKIGLLKINNTFLKIKITHSQFPSAFYDRSNSKIFLDINDWNQYFVVGDTVYLENKKYLINNVAYSGDTLYFSYLGEGKLSFGAYPGEYAYNIISTDLQTNAPFNLNKFSDKFVLLDFWGSWCEPCIKSIPDLVKISKKYKSSLEIVSIAEDYQNHIGIIKNLIRNEDMRWIHLFENLKDASEGTIAYRYKVYSYPTQILINPKGKIIFRSTTNSKLIENKLDSLLKLEY